MPRLPRVTAEEVLRALQRDGWYIVRQKGSHAQLLHPTKAGRVTIAAHRRDTVRVRTLASILEQAALSAEDFRRLL